MFTFIEERILCSWFTVKPGLVYRQDFINEFIICKLNPLIVVDFRFTSAVLYA